MPVFMPIFIKVANWQQTPTNITIKIPSYGVHVKNVDFLTHEKYIKAHYQQYIFEIFLWKLIDISKSNCFVSDTEIIFELTKLDEEIWEKLEADLDKTAKKELRLRIIEENQQKSEEERKLRVSKNAEFKRTAVREQIALDTKKHQAIDSIKNTEKENSLKQLLIWEENKPKETFKKSTDQSKYKTSNKITTEKIPDSIKPAIPLPRKTQTLNIKFTTREFSTPTRESRAQEEQEWLSKQAAARRSAGFDSNDLRPEEKNPQWLKSKGDEFFKAKNYLGAISAYTEGINMSKEFVDLYVNRSAAHFAVGNLQRTIEDCSAALNIMNPPVLANLDMRAKCIARRGAALCKIGLVKQGVSELEAALKLVPNNQTLKEDLDRIKREMDLEI